MYVKHGTVDSVKELIEHGADRDRYIVENLRVERETYTPEAKKRIKKKN